MTRTIPEYARSVGFTDADAFWIASQRFAYGSSAFSACYLKWERGPAEARQ